MNIELIQIQDSDSGFSLSDDLI